MNSAEFIRQISDTAERDALAEKTAAWLAGGGKKICIMKHVPEPLPFSVVADYGCLGDVALWQETFSDFSASVIAGEVLPYKDRYYIFLQDDYSSEAGYFLICSARPDKDVIETARIWRACDLKIKKNQQATQAAASVENGNIVSQLLHDVEAIMQLIPEQAKTSGLNARLAYHNRLNKNLLFNIPPLEMLCDRLPVSELIKSSLQFGNLSAVSFQLTIAPEVTDIDVDAELFARGFAEIVNNALYACGGDSSKINICVDIKPQVSPLLQFNWLTIAVSDKGPGVAEDFIERLKEPFFTTRKNEGYSGFGLSIADKIFRAHKGRLELNSMQGSGLTVTIYLPLKNE